MTAIAERVGPGTIRGLLEQGAYVDQIDQHGMAAVVGVSERGCGGGADASGLWG